MPRIGNTPKLTLPNFPNYGDKPKAKKKSSEEISCPSNAQINAALLFSLENRNRDYKKTEKETLEERYRHLRTAIQENPNAPIQKIASITNLPWKPLLQLRNQVRRRLKNNHSDEKISEKKNLQNQTNQESTKTKSPSEIERIFSEAVSSAASRLSQVAKDTPISANQLKRTREATTIQRRKEIAYMIRRQVAGENISITRLAKHLGKPRGTLNSIRTGYAHLETGELVSSERAAKLDEEINTAFNAPTDTQHGSAVTPQISKRKDHTLTQEEKNKAVEIMRGFNLNPQQCAEMLENQAITAQALINWQRNYSQSKITKMV